MKTWTVEPRDPLIARDGRPSALGRFDSLPFPLPSTLAGAARTRMASADGVFSLARTEAAKLLGLAVHGPLLVELTPGENPGQGPCYFAPAPRDAVLYSAPEGGPVSRWGLSPRVVPEGAAVDTLGDLGLAPLSYATWGEGPTGKPLATPPAFWSWPSFERWLIAPQACSAFDLDAEGLPALPRERRVHVALEPGERVGVEGAVFETEGLRFLAGPEDKLAPRRLALSLRAESDPEGRRTGHRLELRAELAPLGGERRLAWWRPSDHGWPGLPPEIPAAIVASRRARLVLLSPACFANGALPGWNGGALPGLPGVTATVRGAAVSRAVVVSGWDLATGHPKPTRRLAPAGSVYFVELDGAPEQLARWCESLWLQSISDDEQTRRDGFGLVALGAWPEEAP